MNGYLLIFSALVFVCVVFVLMFTVAIPEVAATSNATNVRCEVVDDWLRPSGTLEDYWIENVGVGCE